MACRRRIEEGFAAAGFSVDVDDDTHPEIERIFRPVCTLRPEKDEVGFSRMERSTGFFHALSIPDQSRQFRPDMPLVGRA